MTYAFCAVNRIQITVSQEDAYQLVMDVATGLDDLHTIAKRLGLN